MQANSIQQQNEVERTQHEYVSGSSVQETLREFNQEQLLTFYDKLSENKRSELEDDLKQIDWKTLSKIYQEQVVTQLSDDHKLRATKIDDELLQELPEECIEGTNRCDQDTLNKYNNDGLEHIKHGKIAALLLAGGQGTRLGVNDPKGMFDVGLPSHKTLYQLQAERIRELCKTASGSDGATNIIWYIMTSDATMEKTKLFFGEHKYFGLDPSKIVFFEQGKIPCFDFNGKVFLGEQHRVSRSPNGNGGLFESLHGKSIIDHMKQNGIEYVHVYCVDNILVRVCDPTFMGYCIAKDVDVGAKVVKKVQPNEAVGTICKVRNKFKVIEYSEISDSIANRRNAATGELSFNAGNICEHFFKVKFLESIKEEKVLPYHLAIKKIPFVSLETGERIKPTENNGIKLEKFIFDVFEFTDKFAAWEVKREDEFSPLKNADGSPKDNPTTARESLLRAYKLGILNQ